MQWFRVTLAVGLMLSFLMALIISWAIIQSWLRGSSTSSIEMDPEKNGTTVPYLFILVFQFQIIINAVFGFVVCFKVWRNNYQMDHKLRHLFIVWLSCWCCSTAGLLTVCVFALVRGKEPQTQMAVLFDSFQRFAQDTTFVASFERYQRSSSCCGIYSAEDWLYVQVHGRGPMMGGGGGGYQSLDYGYRQNPSTGKCHMTPPTIPTGCGKKITLEVNAVLSMYAGLSVCETVVAIVSGAMAWYCFFYWLEKEVIVIPEDEVSNLIIIEPESSESIMEAMHIPTTGFDVQKDSRYLYGSGYGGGRSQYLGSGQYGFGRMSQQGQGYYNSQQRTATKAALLANSGSKAPPLPPAQEGALSNEFWNSSDIINTQTGSNSSKQGQPNNQGSVTQNPTEGSQQQQQQQPPPQIPPPMPMRSAYSRYPPQPYHKYYHNKYHPHPYHNPTRVSLAPTLQRGLAQGKEITQHNIEEHILRLQEKALGGKVLAEMKIDHKLDPKGVQNDAKADPTKKGKGGRKKHATVAIVRNTKPQEKQNIPLLKHNVKGHGQTGNLAQDIAVMSGKNAKKYIDDVKIPLSHPQNVPRGEGYIQRKKRERDDETRRNANKSKISAISMSGVHAQNSIDKILEAGADERKASAAIRPHHIPPPPPVSHYEERAKMMHSRMGAGGGGYHHQPYHGMSGGGGGGYHHRPQPHNENGHNGYMGGQHSRYSRYTPDPNNHHSNNHHGQGHGQGHNQGHGHHQTNHGHHNNNHHTNHHNNTNGRNHHTNLPPGYYQKNPHPINSNHPTDTNNTNSHNNKPPATTEILYKNSKTLDGQE